jgi:hypothetical protein
VWAALSSPALAIDVDCRAAGNDRYVYVRVETAEVLAQPTPGASKVAALTLGAGTCVLTSSGDGETAWVFVRGYWMQRNREPVQGWLPRSAVAYTKELKRLTQVRAQKVSVDIGDYYAEYDIQEGGTFSVGQVVSDHRCKKREVANEYGACEDRAVVRGEIMGSGILALSVSTRLGADDVFKLRSDGILCPWQYGSPPESCR